jgi:hypothetical protein
MDDRFVAKRRLLRRLWAGTLTITTLCVQYTSIIMASSQSQPAQAGKAFWNDQEVSVLLDYLQRNKAQTEGMGNFKEQVWTGAVEAIAPSLSRGPVKTVKMCQTKWTAVCCHRSIYNLNPCTDHLLSSSVHILQSKLIVGLQVHTGTTMRVPT